MKTTILTSLSVLALAACGGASETPPTASTQAAPEPVAEVPAGPVEGSLEWAVAGEWRNPVNAARDGSRNPLQTLSFFGLEGDDTVVEITPGGGWYTEIIAPYIAAGGGAYYAAGYDTTDNERRRRGLERFKQRFADTAVFGDIRHSLLGADVVDALAPAGSADMVLSFRNVHNWMSAGIEVKVAEDAYKALKPGGIFGVVEHRLPSAAEQDPKAASGYVHEAYMIAVAEEAGFVLAESSEVNANPADTADHPFGVWTLPPTSIVGNERRPAPEGFDPAKYREIGESDRFTLKFMKPAE